MQSWKGVKYDSSGTVISCIFCRICDKLEPAAIVSENNKFVAFKNIAPVTKDHLLIAPRNHVKNCSSLEGEQGARLIEEMLEFGKAALNQPDDCLYCFHLPPYNSIDHLHLHCIVNPEKMSWLSYLKYNPNLSWCATPEYICSQLRKGL